MRPEGEIRGALMSAAQALVHRDDDGRVHGPTLRELAERACVGYDAAMATVKNMTRAGALEVVDERAVPYRNRPVAEYAPAGSRPVSGPGYVDLGHLLAVWK
jgi:hypothetical protein